VNVRFRHASKAVTIKIHKTMVKPVRLCGTETHDTTEMYLTRLSLGERKLLRRKYGPVAEQGMESKNWLGIERAV
jgi:hypothetical protein